MTTNNIEKTMQARREIDKVRQQIAKITREDILYLGESEIDYWLARNYIRELLLNNLAMVKQTAGTDELIKFTAMMETLIQDILEKRIDLDKRKINLPHFES